MPLIDEAFADGIKCKCERLMRVIHCVACGSLAVEKKRRLVTVTMPMEDGTEKRFSVPNFVCRRCGYAFDDTKRLRCAAHPVPLSIKAQRVLDATKEELARIKENEDLSWEERKVKAFKTLEGLGLARSVKQYKKKELLSTEIPNLPEEDKEGIEEVRESDSASDSDKEK
jgi:hypothetical protein